MTASSPRTNGILPTLGDANGDGDLDLVIAPDDGRPELIRIFTVDTGEVIGAVPGGLPAFPGGIRVALGVLTGGPGASEIVVGNGPSTRACGWSSGRQRVHRNGWRSCRSRSRDGWQA